MNARKRGKKMPLGGKAHAAAMAAYGAHVQLDRTGAHRMKVVPNKKREAGRRACRGGW